MIFLFPTKDSAWTEHEAHREILKNTTVFNKASFASLFYFLKHNQFVNNYFN